MRPSGCGGAGGLALQLAGPGAGEPRAKTEGEFPFGEEGGGGVRCRRNINSSHKTTTEKILEVSSPEAGSAAAGAVQRGARLQAGPPGAGSADLGTSRADAPGRQEVSFRFSGSEVLE